jgi:hypothetical protein
MHLAELLTSKYQKTKSLRRSLGQLIETVFDGELSQGKNLLSMQTFNIPAGVYLISLSKEDGVVSKKVLIP